LEIQIKIKGGSRLKDEVEWASDFARYSSEGKFEKTERGRELFEKSKTPDRTKKSKII